jgi:hypothetical protein
LEQQLPQLRCSLSRSYQLPCNRARSFLIWVKRQSSSMLSNSVEHLADIMERDIITVIMDGA